MRIEELQSSLPDLAVMGGEVDLDWSAAVSALIFLVLMVVLNKVLFQPYLEIVARRDAMTEGATGSALAMQAEARALETQYAQEAAAAQSEATVAREALRAAGKAEEAQILAAARQQAAGILSQSRTKLQGEIASAEGQLDAQAAMLATAIVSRMTTEA